MHHHPRRTAASGLRRPRWTASSRLTRSRPASSRRWPKNASLSCRIPRSPPTSAAGPTTASGGWQACAASRPAARGGLTEGEVEAGSVDVEDQKISANEVWVGGKRGCVTPSFVASQAPAGAEIYPFGLSRRSLPRSLRSLPTSSCCEMLSEWQLGAALTSAEPRHCRSRTPDRAWSAHLPGCRCMIPV